MSKKSTAINSRNEWKSKAVKRADNIRYPTKELRRIKNDRNKYKEGVHELRKEVQDLKIQLKQEQEKNKQSVLSKEYLFYTSLQLFFDAHISFIAVNRVLDVLSDDLGLEKVP